MDRTLKGVTQLVGGNDVETRCAALLVLTRLGADEAAVVRCAGECLGAKNAVVRDFALTYFEQVRPRPGLDWLLPLLDSQEDAVRRRAGDILVVYGNAAVSAAGKHIENAPRRRLNAIIAVCARVHSGAALDILFRLMAGDDPDTNRLACDALLAAVPEATARTREEMFKRADSLAGAARGQRAAQVAAAKILGALQQPKARKRLFGMLGKASSDVIRSHALAALAQCLRGQKLTSKEIAALVEQLAQGGEPSLVRPAIRLLEDQTLDRSYMPQLNRLAESPEPYVKRFAVQKLGAFESGAVVKTLIAYLTDDSYARRDQAASSLKTLPAARTALMKEFAACDDERKAWTLADILLVHDRSWKRDTVEALAKKLEHALERREDRLYSAYAHFLNTLDAEAFAERVRARVERLRKRKNFSAAVKWLGLLKDTPAFDDEIRFSLLVAELKSHRRAPSAAVRRHDPVADLGRELIRNAFPLSDRLRRERLLTAEELFYTAFQLAEGRPEERAVAEELLEHVKAEYGRTKVGKAAKNKLALLARRP
jgi:HEAT repeat protein